MANKNINVCILTGYGINTDYEMYSAFKLVGGLPERIHINFLINNPVILDQFSIVVIPGGFSFGDHVGSGTILASLLRIKLGNYLQKVINRGSLILGVCNGFQVLVKMGLLPSIHNAEQTVTLVHNESGKFEDRWISVEFNKKSPCLWTNGIEEMELPVRHGEGRIIMTKDVLADIEKYNLCPIRYSKKGFIHKKDLNVLPYPSNPNGSINNIAGLCDTTGQVFGLMPHPEAFLYRFHHPRWRNEPLVHENALKIFRNAVNYIRS